LKHCAAAAKHQTVLQEQVRHDSGWGWMEHSVPMEQRHALLAEHVQLQEAWSNVKWVIDCSGSRSCTNEVTSMLASDLPSSIQMMERPISAAVSLRQHPLLDAPCGAGAWQLVNEDPIGVNESQGFVCHVPRFSPWFSPK